MNHNDIWAVADLLRGDYKQSDYGKVILPFTVLRRLDCVLAATKGKVLETVRKLKAEDSPLLPPYLTYASGLNFYNVSELDMKKLLGDQDNIHDNLIAYIQGFSENARSIFECFEFSGQIDRLQKAGLLYLVTEKFTNFDLHPDAVSNTQMGTVFEELIRKFSEISNETAGEHFTPREVIRLMVELIFSADKDELSKSAKVRTVYDPTAGTGGMLSVAEEYLYSRNPKASLSVYGQELNPESYAICKADMLIKGQDVDKIILGNTLSDDGLPLEKFDYMLSNPPYGVEWKKVETQIRAEAKNGFAGRFGPGVPRVSDGSLLFLLHLISKMRTRQEGGSRIGIVLNGSPLFTGGAGSGESNIRRYIIEHDLLEAIIALPTDMFYNTGIATYVWILSNRKEERRRGKVQLINAAEFFQKMRKSLGSKRKELGADDIERIVGLYENFSECKESKIFDNVEFGYTTITVERPLRLVYKFDEKHLAQLDQWIAEDCKLTDERREELRNFATLVRMTQTGQEYFSESEFKAALKEASTLKLSAVEQKQIATALADEEKRGKERPGKNGHPEPSSTLRDTENVPLKENINTYFQREVLPYVPDAWIDDSTRENVGYEIPFNRYFYEFKPPRPLEEIDADLTQVAGNIMRMLQELEK